MTNLREIVESDLAKTLEGDFGQKILLTAPDGEEFEARGRIDYNTRVMDPETGEEKVINLPAVTLRKSTLLQVPVDGELWYFRIPTSPVAGAPVERFVFSPTRAIEDGSAIGFMKIFLQRAEQSA